MTSTDRPAAEMDNEDVLHEASDIDVRTIFAFAAGLVAMVAVSFVLMGLAFRFLERQAAARDPQLSPLARATCPFADLAKCEKQQLPPEPRLQTDEHGRLEKFRMEETKGLESYGWVNQSGGVAHMPIAEAKKLILERGLPVRAEASPDPRLGSHAYAMGESSGGRTIGVPAAPSGAQPPPAAAPPAAGEPHGTNK